MESDIPQKYGAGGRPEEMRRHRSRAERGKMPHERNTQGEGMSDDTKDESGGRTVGRFDDNEMPGPLAAKVAKAMVSIDSVPKRGTNNHHGYSYATADDVMQVARKALGNVGVAVFPSVVGEEWSNSGKMKSLKLRMKYLVVDGETGSKWSGEWRAEAQDKGDKAYYKAMTQSKKYFLRELLNISTGEPLDVEFDGSAPRQGGASASANEVFGNEGGGNGGGSKTYATDYSGNDDWKAQNRRYHALMNEAGISGGRTDEVRESFKQKIEVESWKNVEPVKLKAFCDKIEGLSAEPQKDGPPERSDWAAGFVKD